MNGARLLESLFQADPKATASVPKKRAGQGEFASQFLAMLFNESNPKDALPGRHTGAEKAAGRDAAASKGDQNAKPAPSLPDTQPGVGGRWAPRFDVEERPAGLENSEVSETAEPLELESEPVTSGEAPLQRQAKLEIPIRSAEPSQNPADRLIDVVQEPARPGMLVSSPESQGIPVSSPDAPRARVRFSETQAEGLNQALGRPTVQGEQAGVSGARTESMVIDNESAVAGVAEETESSPLSAVESRPRATNQLESSSHAFRPDEPIRRSVDIAVPSGRRGSAIEGSREGVSIGDETPVDPGMFRSDRRHVHPEDLATSEPTRTRPGSGTESDKRSDFRAIENRTEPARPEQKAVHARPSEGIPPSEARTAQVPDSSAAPRRMPETVDPAPGRLTNLMEPFDQKAAAASEPGPAQEVLQKTADAVAAATKPNRTEVPAPESSPRQSIPLSDDRSGVYDSPNRIHGESRTESDAKSGSGRESANPDSSRQAARTATTQSSAQVNTAQVGAPTEGAGGAGARAEQGFKREVGEASEMSKDGHGTNRPVKAETGSHPVQGPQAPGTGSHWVPGAVVRAEHASAGSRVPASHAATVSGEAAPERIFEQIVQTTKLEKQNGLERFTVNLKPGFLGRIEIETDLGSDESLRAIIRVEDPTVKKAVEQGLANLIERLGELGLDIGSAEVTDFLAGDERREGGSPRAGNSGHRSRGFTEDNAVESESTEAGSSDDGAFSYFA